jgi:hypothetical protein
VDEPDLAAIASMVEDEERPSHRFARIGVIWVPKP